ncbi:carotenoid oxygenase family protein [Sphingopyxis sp. OPL5]|uniref:carotenoid oxygenase family protein n=1 Tax=Sphingopyxis sp. OPL5 TaxID=2486273 RepID=UPI00164D613F|nr:carotenoid oxygenase family protein [Sphingopyxis sp. OPL5]QNO27679.1 carotenoid oxygenase family protein [Sphingopyxis sp. OPL5]
MTQAFFDHPYLSGHHQPVRFEGTAPDLIVEGEIPADLVGVFYRNGPEPLYPTREGEYHWFDGDGMVYAFHIEGGRAAMLNRWVRTEKFELEKAAGKRLFGLFGNPMTADPSVAGKRYNTANTNIIVHGGKLLALMEGAPAVQLDPRTLETLGEEHYGGTITTTFSAHPKIDHFTGELINIGMAINGPMGAPQMRYDVIAADGSVRRAEVIDMPHNALMHTFFLTENWVVFPVIPIDADLGRFMKGGPMTAWVNGRPTKFGVMPREGSASDIRWFDYEPRHMFHELNVWEQDGKIVADVAAANGTALFPDETGVKRTHGDTQQSLRRWTIDPGTNGNGTWIKEETLNDRDIQFPRPDDRFMTRASRHSFANINLNSRDGRAEGMDGVLRFDTVSGQEDYYHFGNGASCGEMIFAPRVGAQGEGDGYAMTLVHRAGAATSELAIFDALDIAAGPVAMVQIPFRVPSGFHCNFYAADSMLYRQALGEGRA